MFRNPRKTFGLVGWIIRYRDGTSLLKIKNMNFSQGFTVVQHQGKLGKNLQFIGFFFLDKYINDATK